MRGHVWRQLSHPSNELFKILTMVQRLKGNDEEGCPLALFFYVEKYATTAIFGEKLAYCCTPIYTFLAFLCSKSIV